MENNLYPLTLSYTLPNGMKYSVTVYDEAQSEDEYHKMFDRCGRDVLFSVD